MIGTEKKILGIYVAFDYTLARFIWNAEISVSVAIHCYKRLF